jgi:O-antigen/teichoic acid export membrane protein
MGLVLGVAFLIIPLATLFLGNYAPGIPAARILFAGFYFMSLVGPAANLLITINRQMQYLFWLVAVAILVAALDGIAIIANLGIEGIAAATGISYAVYALGIIAFALLRHLACSRRELGKMLTKIILPFLSAAGALWSVSQIRASSQLVLVGLQLVLFMAIYGLISYFLLRREFSP